MSERGLQVPSGADPVLGSIDASEPTNPSAEYLAALEAVRRASERYRLDATEYRAGRMSDDQYLAARERYSVVSDAFDVAYDREMSGQQITFDEYGNMRGYIPPEAVAACSGPFRDEAVAYWVNRLGFRVPIGLAIDYLAECGAWSREELSLSSDELITQRVFWIACGDIQEQGDWVGLSH